MQEDQNLLIQILVLKNLSHKKLIFYMKNYLKLVR